MLGSIMQMMLARPIQRFRRLTAPRRKLLARSAMLLAAASTMVAAMPFRRAIRFGSAPLIDGAGNRASVADCLWAIEAAARYIPLRTMCIEKGLAAQRLLRRHGYDARLHYGARTDALSAQVAAHVWVSIAGEIVLGGHEAPAFAEIATYP